MNELEEVLNQQIINLGLNLVLNNDVDQIEGDNGNLQGNDGPALSIIYDSGKVSESQIDANLFSCQLDAFDINQFGLEVLV